MAVENCNNYTPFTIIVSRIVHVGTSVDVSKSLSLALSGGWDITRHIDPRGDVWPFRSDNSETVKILLIASGQLIDINCFLSY